jgi:hypothetical protein
MMLSRIAEVGWGVAVAVTVVSMVTWIERKFSPSAPMS